jgi:hypothetical protein
MAYSVRYYLTDTGAGIITIERDEPFETTEWSVESFDSDSPPRGPLLFTQYQSGNGVLSDDGQSLTITIPLAPVEYFTLTVGSFRKILNLTDGRVEVTSIVVPANDVKWSTDANNLPNGFGSGASSMALAFFNSAKTPATVGQNHSARLYQGNKLRCFVFGTTFNYVWYTDPNSFLWPYGGILFYKFVWVDGMPELPETFTMLLDAGTRSGGEGKQQYQVTLSSTKAEGPTSQIFNVQAGSTFVLDDGWLS